MDERKRLTLELMAMKDKDQFIIDICGGSGAAQLRN